MFSNISMPLLPHFYPEKDVGKLSIIFWILQEVATRQEDLLYSRILGIQARLNSRHYEKLKKYIIKYRTSVKHFVRGWISAHCS
jgi:hypothetical protein